MGKRGADEGRAANSPGKSFKATISTTAAGGATQPAAQPVAKQPAAQQPTAQQPTAQQPTAQQPAAHQPAVQQPAAQQPAPQQPAAQLIATLMIANHQPFRPLMLTMEDITAGRAGSVTAYMEKLEARVRRNSSVCPQIDNAPKNAAAGGKEWRPTSVMEPLDMEHCIAALTHSNFYEGIISIWNLDPLKTYAFDTQLNLRDPTWLQLNVLTGYWSDDNQASSHAEAGKQRYFFPEMVMSFVKDIALLQAKHGNGTGEPGCVKCQPAAATNCVGRFTSQLMKRLRLEM